MFQDCRGLALTTESEEAVAAFDHVVDGYLGYRADMTPRMEALLAADPDFGMAHCLKGYLFMMGFQRRGTCRARRPALEQARCRTGSAREEAPHRSPGAWIDGDPDAGGRGLGPDPARAPARHPGLPPRPFRQFLVRPAGGDARLGAGASSAHWSAALPGYASILACRCFAHEECGYYLEAELRRTRGDPPRPHRPVGGPRRRARAGDDRPARRGHRLGRGAAAGLGRRATTSSTICGGTRRCITWNLATCDRVLALYDGGFRDLASPLTGAAPDLYIDVQNAASMLFRLGRHGVDVGDRWVETGRQGRGPHRRLPVRVHPAALDDGAGRDRARRGRAPRCWPGCATSPPADHPLAASGAATSPCRSPRRCWRTGRARHVDALALMRPVLGEMYPHGRQPRSAGRAGAGVPQFRAEGGAAEDDQFCCSNASPGATSCRPLGAAATRWRQGFWIRA